MTDGKPRILIIYTGGTIGMIQNARGTLQPFSLKNIFNSIPSIQQLGIDIYALELGEIIDSSNVTPKLWVQLAQLIQKNYLKYDGFVILHGSDTMAYSASALSFLLENLGKPVIFTGSQLPIGLPRTDARENLITALEIAALRNKKGQSLIPEVCIYFEDKLYRGNRTHKFNTQNFDAFLSPNYPILAECGVRINVFKERLLSHSDDEFVVRTKLNTNVAVVRIFPGFKLNLYTKMFIENRIEALVIESYGSGNGPTDKQFLSSIKMLADNNITIMNVTQCKEGRVEMGKYETSEALLEMGVISGADITTEAAIAKAMYVLSVVQKSETRAELLAKPLRGEMTL